MKKYILTTMLVLALVGCGKKDEVKEEKVVLRPVKYQVIEKVSSNLNREFPGTIQAEKESKLSFRVGGTIDKKFAKLGDEIQKGQILAELDKIDYEIKYQVSLASLEQSKANLIKAQADFERYQKLYFNDNVSKADYDSSLANFKSAKAQVTAAEKQSDYDNLQLNYTKLVSPANGIIAAETSEENETVAAGTAVYTLSLDGDLEVEFFVPESLIAQIYQGESILVDTDSAKGMEAIVTQVGRVSTGFGRTFPVKAELKAPTTDIKSGMTATVNLDFKFSDKDVIIVPLNSVITDTSGETFVYILESVANGEGTVTKATVEVGTVTTKGLEIVSGLDNGDLIVTAGMSKIVIGEKVEVPGVGGNN